MTDNSNVHDATDTNNVSASRKAEVDKTLLFYQALSYAIFIALGIYLFIKAGDLPPSKWEPLGASAFPKIILGLIIFIGGLAFITDLMKIKSMKTTAIKIRWNPDQHLVLYLFILLGFYLGLTPLLGFKLMTFVFLLAAQILLGPKTKRSLIISLITAVVFSVGIYALFEHAFNIYLPRSSLF